MAWGILPDGCDPAGCARSPDERTLHILAPSTLEPPEPARRGDVDQHGGRHSVGEKWELEHSTAKVRFDRQQGEGVEDGEREETLSHEPRAIPQPLFGWRATCHGRNDGTWKHEMINGLAMAKEEVDCRLRISYRNRVARIAGAWHFASHRGCVRACVRAWLGGRAGISISSASVTASKIAALQSNRAYLATMQSLRVTMHRGFHGGQRSCA